MGLQSAMRSAFAILMLALPACVPSRTPISHSGRSAADSENSFPLQDFTFIERSGDKISKADLRGKVWIASFVFTRCTGPCPQVTATMARLQSELADQKDLRLVTFTVDPARDDPAELRKYAEHFRADKERWLFLTGDEKELHQLLQKSFKVPVMRNAKSTKPSEEFDHSTRLVVVDREGCVRGYFDGIAEPSIEGSQEEFERSLKQLKELVAKLLKTT